MISDSPARSASETEPRPPNAADACLLTVIYPVFDTRGEATDRIRLWTQVQDLAPDRYCVVVVAGPRTELDEARLRKVLRNHDVILRVPGDGRENDYWNAGASQARTPWLLFVEAHGLPEPDCLSALAAWIDANPDGKVCNFTIENLDHHRVAKLMQRWFAQIHAEWAASSTWRRLHRTAFAIRRDTFEDVGPVEAEYGQFAPALLSARMHQCNLVIANVPTSRVIHDDSPEMSDHHDDTANYARGEMDARSRCDPAFFEHYFGSSPLHGGDLMLQARDARSMLRALLIAALDRRGDGRHLLKRAFALLPAALLGLRHRASLLGVLTRVDERVVMHMPWLERLRWRRFLLAHRRVVQATQMHWLARHPSLPLDARAGSGQWSIADVGQHAIVGMRALEHFGGQAFRWTGPVFLIRLARPAATGRVMLETRKLRDVALSDLVVVVGGRILASEDIAIDDSGNITFQIRRPLPQATETDIVVMVRELHDGGRRLGLPLFSVQFTGP
jgi:hypothetical protein